MNALPCPYCNEEPTGVVLDKEQQYAIICANYYCPIEPETEYYGSMEEAEQAWYEIVTKGRKYGQRN